MSIVTLNKVTLLGHVADKEQILDDLQELGCLHLIPLAAQGDAGAQLGPFSRCA